MGPFSLKDLEGALKVVSSTISKCEKIQPKFVEGTSQHTLLKNRIKALHISKALISSEAIMDKYTKEELIEALPLVSSIISKCEKAQKKSQAGSSLYVRLNNIIKAMNISKSLITDEIEKWDTFQTNSMKHDA